MWGFRGYQAKPALGHLRFTDGKHLFGKALIRRMGALAVLATIDDERHPPDLAFAGCSVLSLLIAPVKAHLVSYSPVQRRQPRFVRALWDTSIIDSNRIQLTVSALSSAVLLCWHQFLFLAQASSPPSRGAPPSCAWMSVLHGALFKVDDCTADLPGRNLPDGAAMFLIGVGEQHTARENHTAALLNNGTVLVAGGDGSNNFASLASSELYVPVGIFPTSLSFPDPPAGTTSESETVTLTNSASTALSIPSIAISGTNASDFAETDNCLGSVAAGASCSLFVTFTPPVTGSRAGILAIVNNLHRRPADSSSFRYGDRGYSDCLFQRTA